MLETATKYVLDLLTENEELKKFPKEFTNEAIKWVKSWFLTPEDPKTNAKLEDPNKSIEVKKDIVQDKLDDLKENAQFQKKLTERLAAFEQLKTTKFNVIEGGSYKIKGNAHIGTIGTTTDRQADEENVIRNGQFEVGGDFRLGNTTQIVHNYFGNHKTTEKTPPQYNDLKKQIESLIAAGKTEKAIETFLDIDHLEEDTRTSLLLQSGRINLLNRQINNGTLSDSTAKVEWAKINAAVLSLLKELR